MDLYLAGARPRVGAGTRTGCQQQFGVRQRCAVFQQQTLVLTINTGDPHTQA
ncbi:hypothetical protein D3C85_1734480 [compost metagenome]